MQGEASIGQARAITVAFSGDGVSQQAVLPPNISSFKGLLEFVRRTFKQQGEVVITDGSTNISCDEHVQQLQPGQRLLVRPGQQGADQPVFKERISFNPHPKTLTMAGDYEYFAAQGHHPLAFALAELIDNALRATKGNVERPRSITVSLVTDEKSSKGMVCVRDNGSGMAVQELNNWAVMNLSMEDRGLLNTEEEKCGNRYLSSDISYFGVGSKNAAFYLGKTVKVVSKTSDSSYVHELCIQAAELERRYRDGQAVYEEDMLHRQPGDASSLAAAELPFTQPQALLQEEAAADGGSFTRILIYDLKPDVLGQLCDEDEGATVLRDLAHLYHYYLHGAKGNTFTSSHASVLPNGEQVPDILVERYHGCEQCWRKMLAQVEDDLESRYLAAKRDQLDFVLSVPNHGKVEGVLWYFPYENDQETVPLDPHTMGRMMLTSHRDGPTQPAGGGQGALTQVVPSQLAAWQSQKGHGTQHKRQAELEPEQDAGYAALLAACPTFEAFWQGRLIPGASVDTLPFIRSVRAKRTAAGKDQMPDEVFSRIRGALFFGPGFRVTRNKLTFRDNLSLLLESASPTDRQLEKHFKEWLTACHRNYDRSVKFEVLCHPAAQAHARRELGKDVTIFERISDGLQTISKGDIIRLSTKPAVLGRVEHFSIPHIVQVEGHFSGGSVTVRALPLEVLGPDNMHTWPLRRLEGLVSGQELEEHVSRELAKLPAGFRFEPLNLAKGDVVTLPAGSGLPETSISVVNGTGNRVVKSLVGGQRQQLKVVQILYYLGPAGTARKRTAAAAAQGGSNAAADAEAAVPAAEEAGGKKGGKRGKRRKRGAAAAEAAEDEAAATAAAAEKENDLPGTAFADGKKAAAVAAVQQPEDEQVCDGEVVLSFENKSPIQDTFQFQRISGGLTRAGCYCLQYSLLPELPGGRTLRFSIDLQVTAGPPVSFDIRGEGRAVALSKSIMLGEALPPLRLLLHDSHGNAVPADAASWAERQVQLQVLQGSVAGGGAVLQELNVVADTEVQQDELCLVNVRVLGPSSPAPGGMQLFKLPAPDAAAEARATGRTQRGTAAAPPPAATLPIVRSVDVTLAAHIEGLAPQGFPLRLAPGAPHSLRLLAGHPFSQKQHSEGEQEELAQQLMTQLAPEQQLVAAQIMSSEQLPTFKVQTLDVWGNATCPNDVLPFEVALRCAATDPDSSTFPVDDRGVATISGLTVQRQDAAGEGEGGSAPDLAAANKNQQHKLLMWPQCGECEQQQLQAALDVAQPQQQTELQLVVLPSTMPAELLMTHQGEELGRRMQEGRDGGEGELVWQLSGVEAGSRVEGLAVRCVDEVGRPAAGGVRGRIQVSWAKGSKKAVLGGDDIRLPSLLAPDAVGQAVPFWVRFVGDPKEWPGVSLDINFEVSVVPGPPASWSVAIVDYRKGAAAAAAAAAGKAGEVDGGADLSSIPCGQPFYLEIEALDACHNRCCFGCVEDRPTPIVQAEADDPEAQLQLDPNAWQHKWDNTQAGGDVCLYKLWLAGPPGPVKLIVRDQAGDDGASLLVPDELALELLPGPAAALVADCPAQLECGTRGLLDSLPIKVVDAYGNLAEGCAFEIALSGSALNAEGIAARVSASGSNRTKLRNGVACFKNVRIQAQAEGVYKLTVGSHSRKIAVQEAMVMVKVCQQNYVCNLEVLPSSLPTGSAGAGSQLQLLLAVHTEDQQPLPWDVLSGSLTLSLVPPSGPPAEAGEAAAGSKAGKGKSGSRKADIIQLTPERIWDGDAEGMEPAVAEAAAAAAQQGCVVCFSTPELTLAGLYTLTADYVEGRADLLPAMPKQEQTLRSTSLQFEVAAGPVASAALQAAGADQETLTISNGKDPQQRRLLRNAVVQLLDSHANPAAVADVSVRWRLLCSDADSREDDAEAPQLCCSEGQLQLSSDARGRAFFGEIAVEQGTGRMPAGAGQSLQCMLEVQVLMPKAPSRRSGSANSWVTVWQCQVLFTDDAARIRELQVLQDQKEQLQQRLTTVQDGVRVVQERLNSAQQERHAAGMQAEKQLQLLRERLKQPGLQMPDSSKEAQQLLQQVKAKAAQESDRPALEARYGSSRQNMTLSISRLLQQGDPDLVGVFAQLGYVDEPRLSAVLAANYCAAMQVMVVKSYEAINRLRQAAQTANMPIPSMLSYTLIQEYTPEDAYGGNIAMQGMSELAQQLLADACQGTDPPLPMPLPHTRQLSLLGSSRRSPPPNCLAANQWPPGCLGFAVNLIRPRFSNTRKGLMYAQLGRTLVFETLDQAAAYRACVVNTLKTSTADIVTLDDNKLSGRGVVVGSNFRVCSIQEAPFRFGTRPAGELQASTQLSVTQCETAAEAVIAALQQKEQAEQDLQAVQEEAQQQQHQQLQQQEAELQQQLEQLQQQIRQQQRSIEGDSRKGAGAARGRQTQQHAEDAAEVVDLAAAEEAPPEGRHRSKRRKQ